MSDKSLELISIFLREKTTLENADSFLVQLLNAENYQEYHQILIDIAEEIGVSESVIAAKLFALNIANYNFTLSGYLLEFLINQGDKLSTLLRMSIKDVELTAALLLSYSSKPPSIFDAGLGLSEHVELALSFQSSLNAGELVLKLADIDRRYCFKAMRKLTREATSTGSEILDSAVYKLLTRVVGGVPNIFNTTKDTNKYKIANIIKRHEDFIIAQASTGDSYREVVDLMFGGNVDESFVVRVLGSKATNVMHEKAMHECIHSSYPMYRPCFDLDKALKCNTNEHRIAVSFEERINDNAEALGSHCKSAKSELNAMVIYLMLWAAVRHGHFGNLEKVNNLLADLDDDDFLERLHDKVQRQVAPYSLIKNKAIWIGKKKIDSLSQALECSDDLRQYKPTAEFVVRALPYIKERDINVQSGNEGSESWYKEDLATIRVMETSGSFFGANETDIFPILISKPSIRSNIHKVCDELLVGSKTEQVIDELSNEFGSKTRVVLSDDYLYALSYLGSMGEHEAIKCEFPYLYNLFSGKNELQQERAQLLTERLNHASNHDGRVSVSYIGTTLVIDFITNTSAANDE